MNEIDKENSGSDEQPPLIGSWAGWYWLVAGTLILLITLFYLFTKFFE